MDEQSFREQARREGYADPISVEWVADTFNDTHTHDVRCSILVLAGEMSLTTGDRCVTCRAGETAVLPRNVPHTERAGPEGVKFLVARR